ncbi:Acetyltransferase, GNAT family protein [Sulfitobacter noctilucae]|uniref:GNAT family N-acetyltransferase n=1 Tax=Sulfitobacter noctilucae TaxID=1342302 RepID=UPI00046939A3|nr:GNAT family N-acetyltransferase [Sulfitobacter noctilucae]KIN65315.1 Acetyltransferase, GNAT family protein [Sulfitobacter noctilucae]
MQQMTDPIPVLDTQRLTLRAPKASDLPTLTAFYETERSHMVGGPRSASQSFTSLASRIGHWALLGYGLWHIDNRENGDFLGWVGVLNPPDWDEPELGWTLFAHAEGKGYAFEAARAARAYAAQEFKLDGMISYIRADNTRSANLARRLGATYERDGEVIGTPCHIWRHPKEAA